ncbi:MAG: hypothetical protein IJD85_09175, partial [Oscillospiraceae bacterium]|nr:hypothetical protein [Oscillospiraceae bacterium]
TQDIVYTIDSGKFTRTLNMPEPDIGDEALGGAVADYMAMFDAAMKQYFSYLPDMEMAQRAAEQSYSIIISRQKVII